MMEVSEEQQGSLKHYQFSLAMYLRTCLIDVTL